jgi:malonate-semialdehyde dehydrogenase (acetylating) / methylmalonate-semialdehyde dehydrogenase
MFSFTGSRGSIQGDANFYGKSGLHFYTQVKTITSNWKYHGEVQASGAPSSGTTSAPSLHMPVFK